MLTSKQRQEFKALAHHLKPTAMIGKKNLDDSVYAAVESELFAHELIKVKLLDTSAVSKKEAAELLAEKTNSDLVSIIGRTIILYRKRIVDPKES